MPTFSSFDVVSLPFPYTDRPIRQRRPALIVSQPGHERATGLLWVVMITAAENRRWAGDVQLSNPGRAGLAIPSVVRPAKIATIEAAQAVRIGSVAPADRRAVQTAIRAILA
jgi:mRNA interferase MazF